MIKLREDFLEVPTQGSKLWISELYVNLAGVRPKAHSTLLGVHGGDVYLTHMAFVGDNNKARAVDVLENRKLYIASAHPSRPFAK